MNHRTLTIEYYIQDNLCYLWEKIPINPIRAYILQIDDYYANSIIDDSHEDYGYTALYNSMTKLYNRPEFLSCYIHI